MSKAENIRASSLKRHEAQCAICCSPRREEFEEAFVRWSSPTDWSSHFHFERYSVYRHAHQFGLFERRRENLTLALEKMVERMDWTQLTGSNGIAAIKMLLELEEKKRKKVESGLTNSRGSAKPKMGKLAETAEGLPEVVPMAQSTGSDEVRGTEDSEAESWIENFVPAMKATETADVVEPPDSVPDEGPDWNFTPAVKAEEPCNVPEAEPTAEPVEVKGL